jgi:CHAD domain-containing protein
LAAGKWIDELTATTAVADAARRVLTLRLQAVSDNLALSLREPEKDTEYVHQLRVATRRARAALDIFRECMAPKAFKRAKRDLRNLRRAAGVARDWDVFLADLTERLAQRPPHRRRAGLDFLTGFALGHRLEAQATLESSVPDSFARDRHTAELLHSVSMPDSGATVLVDLARPCLLDRLHDLDQAVSADLTEYVNLHQVRIAGKRLRYAMEVFAGCFDAEFRTVHYAAVEEMQEILGRTNDSYVATQRLEVLRQKAKAMLPAQWKRLKPNFDELQKSHHEQLAEGLPQFEKWWDQWQKSGGEAMLVSLLETTEPTDALMNVS